MVFAIVTEAKCKEPVKREYTAKTARERKKQTIDRLKKEKGKKEGKKENERQTSLGRSLAAVQPALRVQQWINVEWG